MTVRAMKRTMLAAGVVMVGLGVAAAQPRPAGAPDGSAERGAAGQPAGGSHAFTVGDEGRRFDSATARGSYLAVHFLLNDECPYCARHLREYTGLADTLAGVKHIFVKAVSAEAFGAALASSPEAPLYRDADGKLAEHFKIRGGYRFHGMDMTYPALVLLDPQGREVFRYVGKDNADRLPFRTFAKRVAELSRDAATAHANLEGGPAIRGYDPVAYFTDGKPTRGSEKFESSHRGVTYRFATAANRAAFNAEPEKFVPAYGGWCATAMAEGRKVEINPESFKIVGGRLLLFYKALFGDALADWNKDEPGLKPKADRAWQGIVSGPAPN
ncbi:MAG: YHS domain-containing protein [Phycisphaerae bacterium]|nr:YHS domain-containing protein [Phycisphaerae bacterium]